MNFWQEDWVRNNGGFEDIPVQERCLNQEHEPPTLLYIPPGKQYRHTCPGCGRVTILRPPFISMKA